MRAKHTDTLVLWGFWGEVGFFLMFSGIPVVKKGQVKCNTAPDGSNSDLQKGEGIIL